MKNHRWRRLNRLIIAVVVFLAGISASSVFAAAEDIDPARQEAMQQFPQEYLFVSNENGKVSFIDRKSLQFITEPNGQKIADVWIKYEFDDAARRRLIDSRYGQEEVVEGFECMSYMRQHVWFNLFDPAYRDQSMLPLRMIAQEIFCDIHGEVIYSTYASTTWRGGKWFTLPGFESIVQKVLSMRGDSK